VDFYNARRRHSTCNGTSPIDCDRFDGRSQEARSPI